MLHDRSVTSNDIARVVVKSTGNPESISKYAEFFLIEGTCVDGRSSTGKIGQ